LTTKIHVVADALGNPLRFILSPGQVSDITQAEALIADLPAEHALGDKGYDARSLRDAITEQGAVAVIPPRRNRHRCIVTLHSTASAISSSAFS